MAKDSSIEWTHHTFNPWWGCSKVSAACNNCYAESWAKRMGKSVWGQGASRRFFGDAHWKEPLDWNDEAHSSGHRARVFCASMADVFERRSDLHEERARLWKLIDETPWLDWLLLTKRPQNIESMVPWSEKWPRNVWLGATIENQWMAEKRLPDLLKHPAAVRFLSCEPLLGAINLQPWIRKAGFYPIDWVIAGGESGHHARPMHPDWAKGLLQQCRSAGIAFHFKQWGHWVPAELLREDVNGNVVKFQNAPPVLMARVDKKTAGRILEGVTWDGIPSVAFAVNG